MAIVFGNIVVSASKLAVPCANGFTVNVVVNGIENGTGGTYDVRVYDDDGPFNPDDLLAEKANVPVAVGRGRFVDLHMFDLSCNGDCVVEGVVGQKAVDSGESCVELYGFVRETRPNGNRMRSPGTTDVCCIEEDECVVISDDSRIDPADRISLVGDPADNALIRVRYAAPAPVTQCFADDIDVDIRRVTIGDDTLNFASPVAVTWRLSDSESRLFKDLDARVVHFDPVATKWSSIPFEYTGRLARFTAATGGLYGIARHARFTEICYTAVGQAPLD